MIVILLIVVGVVLARRSKTGDAPRDWLTVAGLLTWRPARRWRSLIAAVLVVAVGHLPGLLLVGALAALTRPWWPAERAWQRACGAADRYVSACVAVRAQDGSRWLDNPYPRPRAHRLVGANVELEVRLPSGLDVDRLREFDTRLAARMNVAQVQTAPHPDRPAGWARVWIISKQLTPGAPVEIVQAPSAPHLITVGHGVHGPVQWDLNEEIGLAIFGAPGAGKGRLARWVALQWLDEQHGRRLTIIDPQGSGEWTPLARHPRARLLSYDPRRPVESLTEILAELDAIEIEGAERLDLTKLHGVDNWASLPAEVRGQHPRSLLLVDEITAFLAKPPAGDRSEQALLIKAIGSKLGGLYRTVRKTGWLSCHVDQLSYADTTTLPPGSVQMLGRWIALGGLGPDAREQISGRRDWPELPARPGLGVTGRRGAPTVDAIEVPNVDRQAVDDTLALALTADLDTRQDLAGA